MLSAGYKVNVIPTEATAHVDGRFLLGYHYAVLDNRDAAAEQFRFAQELNFLPRWRGAQINRLRG